MILLKYDQWKEPVEMGLLDWRTIIDRAIVATGMRPKVMYFHPDIYARVTEAINYQGKDDVLKFEIGTPGGNIRLDASDAIPLWAVSVSDGVRLTQMFNYVTGEPIMLKLEKKP